MAQAAVKARPRKRSFAALAAMAKPAKLPKAEPIRMPKDSRFASGKEIMMRTVILVVTFSAIGNRRKIDVDIDSEADKNWISASKKLFDAEELEAISSTDGEARRYIESRALPSTIKKGVYLLPTSLVKEMDEKLRAYAENRRPLVEKLVKRLDELKTAAKERLKELFDEADYPSAAQLRGAFDLRWRYLHVDSAENLQTVSREIYEREKTRAERDWAETRETIQQVLRANLSEMVNHLVDRLQPEADGKTKIFRESSLDKLSDFLETFDNRNITNDVQMKVLVDKAKGLMKHADPEMLRTHDDVRNFVRNGFETIKQLLDPMVIAKPTRRVIVED